MSANQRLWAQVIKMTQGMLDHAEKDEWEQVSKLESLRQSAIKQCFDTPVPLAETTTVRTHIKQLMAVDQQIIKLGDNKRGQLAGEIQGQRRSRQVCQTYKQCG